MSSYRIEDRTGGTSGTLVILGPNNERIATIHPFMERKGGGDFDFAVPIAKSWANARIMVAALEQASKREKAA